MSIRPKDPPKPAPTRVDAVFAHVLRGIGAKACSGTRDLLRAGKRYTFRLRVSGEVDGEDVSQHFEGALQIGHDSTTQSAPGAKELVAAVMTVYETPAARTRALNRLAEVDFAKLDRALLKEAATYLARLQRTKPKAGEVKVELDG